MTTSQARIPQGRGSRVGLRWKEEFERARAARGLTQEQLAQEINISVQTVRNWSQGISRPSLDMSLRIAQVLHVAPVRVLDWCGYVPGMADLTVDVDQLQDHIRRLERTRAQVPMDGVRGAGLLAQALIADGLYQFRIVPWWRGSGTQRRHFADWIVIDAPDNTSREMIQERHQSAFAFTGAYWNGPEDWQHVMNPPRRDLVIAVPRFHDQRHSGGQLTLGSPRSILVVGQHWCGHAEIGRFLADALDYDYSCVGLVAAVVHGQLPNASRQPEWEYARQDICRTFAWDAGLGRRRVWTADIWTDTEALQIALRSPDGPFVVYLRPQDDLISYSAFIHHQKHRGGSMDRQHYEREMHDLRAEAQAELRQHLGKPGDRYLELPVGLPGELQNYNAATDPYLFR